MLIQISKDLMINTDQVDYIKGYTDIGDGTEHTYIRFVDKDSVIIPISFEEFLKVVKENYI